MSGLALFDMEAPVWEPVWEPRIEDLGWTMPEKGMPLHGDGTEVTKAEWTAYLKSGRCRDCGAICANDMGGGRDGRGFRICAPCALLDGDRLDVHTTVIEHRPGGSSFPAMVEAAHCTSCTWFMFTTYWADAGERVEYTADEVIDACADHETPRHRGRWGRSHEIAECDGLKKRQAQRRARYLAQERVA